MKSLPRTQRRWLLIVLAWWQPFASSCPAWAGPPSPARRLQLADGSRDDVVPVAIDAMHSRWRPAGPDASAPLLDVATPEIVRWGRCPAWPPGPLVILRDGGVIAGRIVSADERSVVVASSSLGRIDLPAGAVRGSRAGLSIGPAGLGAAVDPDERLHRLLLANGDRVSARRITWHGGMLTVELAERRRQDAPADATTTVSIPTEVVRAIDFAAPATVVPRAIAPRIMVAIMDGSRFTIGSLDPAPSEGGVARVRLAARAGETGPAVTCDADEILAIAVDGERAAYLAAREPTAYAGTDEFGPAWGLGRGDTVTGDWPTLRGLTGFTALGIHAPARVRYHVDEPFVGFSSLVAVDDTAGAGGSVVVRILAGVAGGPLHEVFSSAVLRGGDDPQMIRISLPPSTELELVVETADAGGLLDRTLWLDPVILRGGAVPDTDQPPKATIP